MKFRCFVYLLCVICICAFSGCVTISKVTRGNDFDAAKKELIVKGKTTKAEMVNIFGEPKDKGIDSQNREQWIYLYEEGEYKGDPWTGIYGCVESKIRTKKLLVIFDGDIVQNFVYSDSITPSKFKS